MRTSFKFIFIIFMGVFLLGATSLTEAAQHSPTLVIKTLVANLKTAVQKDQASIQNSPLKLYETVQKVLMPKIAIKRMAKRTLGPLWGKATAPEKKAFVAGFSKMLTKMYAVGLLKVMNYEFKVYPLRGTAWKQEQSVSVSGQIIPKNGGSPSRVTYYMTKVNGHWDIYDVAVEGISFAKTFHEQFASFTDMKTLLAKIKQLNDKTFKK